MAALGPGLGPLAEALCPPSTWLDREPGSRRPSQTPDSTGPHASPQTHGNVPAIQPHGTHQSRPRPAVRDMLPRPTPRTLAAPRDGHVPRRRHPAVGRQTGRLGSPTCARNGAGRGPPCVQSWRGKSACAQLLRTGPHVAQDRLRGPRRPPPKVCCVTSCWKPPFSVFCIAASGCRTLSPETP